MASPLLGVQKGDALTHAIRADRVKPVPVDWLWRERIPRGMLTLIAGRPGESKSIFTAFLSAEISNRGELVVLSNMEDPLAQVVRPRVEAAGANLKLVEFWTPGPLPAHFDEVADFCRARKPSLFLMDPIAAHVTSSIYNDQEVRTALSPLAALAAETGTAFVFIHHVVKNFTGGFAIRAIGGSGGGLPGAARAAFIFGAKAKKSDERYLAPAKFNLDVWPKTVAFEIEGHEFVLGRGSKAKLISAGKLGITDLEDTTTAEEILAGGQPIDRDSSPKKALAAAALTNYLAFGPKPASELREDMLQLGHTWKTVRNAADDIGIEKYRVGGSNGHWEWMLPIGHPALVPTLMDGGDDDGD